MNKNVIRISEGIDYRGIGGLVKRIIHPLTTGSVNLAVSICYLAPGEEAVVHSHESEEGYFVLNGEGEMTLGDEKIRLEKNLSIYIRPGVVHGQKNDGNEVLAILCSLSPPPPSK